jgi:hypothetical protein
MISVSNIYKDHDDISQRLAGVDWLTWQSAVDAARSARHDVQTVREKTISRKQRYDYVLYVDP